MGSTNGNSWSNNDSSLSSAQENNWSNNDGRGSTQKWSNNDCKNEINSGIGTWENPGGSNSNINVDKPARNDEIRSWGGNQGSWSNGVEEGGKLQNLQITPKKQDTSWAANDSTGSVELSPGSAWKKDASMVGNWADAVPSPRSDGEENPLNSSLQEAKKSLSNW